MYLMGYSKWLLLSSRLVAGESIISKRFLDLMTTGNVSHVILKQFKTFITKGLD